MHSARVRVSPSLDCRDSASRNDCSPWSPWRFVPLRLAGERIRLYVHKALAAAPSKFLPTQQAAALQSPAGSYLFRNPFSTSSCRHLLGCAEPTFPNVLTLSEYLRVRSILVDGSLFVEPTKLSEMSVDDLMRLYRDDLTYAKPSIEEEPISDERPVSKEMDVESKFESPDAAAVKKTRVGHNRVVKNVNVSPCRDLVLSSSPSSRPAEAKEIGLQGRYKEISRDGSVITLVSKSMDGSVFRTMLDLSTVAPSVLNLLYQHVINVMSEGGFVLVKHKSTRFLLGPSQSQNSSVKMIQSCAHDPRFDEHDEAERMSQWRRLTAVNADEFPTILSFLSDFPSLQAFAACPGPNGIPELQPSDSGFRISESANDAVLVLQNSDSGVFDRSDNTIAFQDGFQSVVSCPVHTFSSHEGSGNLSSDASRCRARDSSFQSGLESTQSLSVVPQCLEQVPGQRHSYESLRRFLHQPAFLLVLILIPIFIFFRFRDFNA